VTDAERVYSLYVQANPVPDPGLLPLTQDEAELLLIEGSRDMDTQEKVEVRRAPRLPRRRVAVVAFVAVLVVVGAVFGIVAFVSDGGEDAVAAADARPLITFDGESCTYNGPSVIEQGSVDFTFVNTSNERAVLVGWRFIDESSLAAELEKLPVGGDIAASEPMPAGGIGSVNVGTEAGESATAPTGLVADTHALDCATLTPAGVAEHVWRAATIEVVAP
jgi:hypothetical protein